MGEKNFLKDSEPETIPDVVEEEVNSYLSHLKNAKHSIKVIQCL